MTTPNTTGPSAEIQRYIIRDWAASAVYAESDLSAESAEKCAWLDDSYIKECDHLAALARAREEARREALANMGNLATTASEFESQRNAALNEVERLRDENARLLAFANEASAIDCGCVSGDCPHMDKADCWGSLASLLRETASEARALIPNTPQGETKEQP